MGIQQRLNLRFLLPQIGDQLRGCLLRLGNIFFSCGIKDMGQMLKIRHEDQESRPVQTGLFLSAQVAGCQIPQFGGQLQHLIPIFTQGRMAIGNRSGRSLIKMEQI